MTSSFSPVGLVLGSARRARRLACALLAIGLALAASAARAQDSVFPSTDPASVTLNNDNSGAIEVGMKFRTSVDGLVTAVRFYKQAGNAGTHVGHLWDAGGTMLGEATFTGETASGWQQVTFPTPVVVTAGTTYTVSYWSSLGNYSDVHPYFTSAVVSGALTALADGTDGGNGVYVYTASPAQPTESWQSSNYWVDLVFTASGNPTVTQTLPVADAAGVSVNIAVTARFSVALDPTTVDGTTFQLRDASNALVPATVAYDAATRTATLTPAAALAYTSTYTATLKGGGSDPRIKDLAGNPLLADDTWSFTTGALDDVPPLVTSTSPASGATGVGVNTTVTATFSEAMDPTSLTGTTFQLLDGTGTAVAAAVSYDVLSETATLTPAAPLAAPATYTARIAGGGGASVARDLAGNALAAEVTWAFTTAGVVHPEPSGWFVGDMHVHRSCGGSPASVASLYSTMVAQDISVISLLADMGNGEVQDPVTDLPLVNGQDDPISTTGRIVHWDAEWHWDATYSQYAHQELGGHLVNLDLTEAHQIWQEYSYPIMEWAHQQGGISGFAHLEYLPAGFPTSLTCCTPIEYPVEVALGGADYISEDVNGGDVVIDAYYRLLNCGFRPGFAAGSDNPCGASIGQMLTFARTTSGQLTYRGWIDGIAHGRTVISRVGRGQFLDLRVNGTATPGDEIRLAAAGDVQVTARWTATQSLSRTIELVHNGVVVASKSATAGPGAPDSLTATVSFPASGWLCARVMGTAGHEVHTSAVFVTVAGAPVRASVADAQFYVQWMDDLIQNTSPGGVWNSDFPTSLAAAQARYAAARTIFQQIATGADVAPLIVTHTPADGATGVAVGSHVTAQFTEALDSTTVTTATFLLKDGSGNAVAATVAYDNVTRTATLAPVAALARSTTYTATLKGGGTDPRIKDLAGTPLAVDSTWTFTTEAPDVTPPTVASTSPAAGAGGVAPSATVRATFSESVAASTVTTTTFALRDNLGALVPATVGYDDASHTATLTPSAALGNGTYTATLKGGSGGIQDLAGNVLAADVSWSFTVTGFNCPCTIWSPTTVPGTVADVDASANELGVKFRASVDGYITGVRFYKSTTNTGTHIGNLWSRTGTLLATATFAGETASGWQEVAFGSPVAITANTTYIASYHTNTGHYAEDDNYFASAYDAPPLRALANGEDGSNGVYHNGAASAFPDTTYHAANYWVDPVFATSIGQDVTPPTVLATTPLAGATGVAVTAAVTATFSEAIDPATVNDTTFVLRDASNALVPATLAYVTGTHTATLTPVSALAYSAGYAATLKGGASGARIRDVAGNALAADDVWAFTTTAPPPPPPTEGPGGPILVISAATNPFSRYFVEILRAEGLNEFTAMDISAVTAGVLANYDVAILGEMPLTASQVTMLGDWTTAGGTLIASRPDKQLAGLMGLTDAADTLSNAYLLVNTASGPGAGIVGQTIQFHGKADKYTLNGATALATLYSGAGTATPYPAVTTHAVGGNGGTAVAFTYDLARSIVYTRQGNPAWAGQKRDGQIPPTRSDDLYYPNWLDMTKVAIPQADEQQRLLANVILEDDLHRKPLPRFWYLPKGLKAAIVMTGDNHGDTGMQSRFEIYRTQSATGCSVDDWECVRATGYEYVGNAFTDAQAVLYNGLGFEVALHVSTNCVDFASTSEYESDLTSQFEAFASTFPDIPLPTTNRNHCIVWSDWSSVPEVESAHGIRLDANYYYWPDTWVNNQAGMFTGSGIPMRFAKLDGTLIDCYQACTQMPDESGETFPQFCDSLLVRALDTRGYYGVFTTNMHFDTSPHPGSDAVVASAQSRGVPVVSAKQMLTWLDTRNGSSFGSLAWAGNALSFTIVTPARNERAMLPTQAASGALVSLTCNGSAVAFTTQTVKGMAYAFFPATAGSYVATYGVDTTGPVISAVTATPQSDGTAAITWTTDEPSSSHVDYGTSSASLTSSASSATLVTSHSVTLTGLASGTGYFYRVSSTDGANNTSTLPLPPATLTFTTPTAPCMVDQTAADFAAGTPTNTYVASEADGEVILACALATEFSGSALPSGWHAGTWGSGGTLAVAGGALTVNGTHASPPVSFGPGTSLEFVATFTAGTFENVGFSADTLFGAPWAVIGEGSSAGGVYARTDEGTSVLLGGALVGSPHLYRIQWTATGFAFYVDGVLVTTVAKTVSTAMTLQVSDFTVDAASLSVDWLHVSPYAHTGSFVSRIFDAGGRRTWLTAGWSAGVPAGTTLGLSVRGGDTPTPDATWTGYQSVAASGGTVGICSRYVQYRADLATADTTRTPVLADFSLTCSPTGTLTQVTDLLAVPQAAGSDGRLPLVLSWSGGGSAKLYRKAYGDYPLFRSGVGAVPAVPASPADAEAAHWTLTGVTASGQADLPPARDEWYYVLFDTDACGRASPPSNAVRSLDYLLGDVSDGYTPCQGNDAVTAADVSLLGTNYGMSVSGASDPLACLDVGPTTDHSTLGRPVPDGAVEFEDLVMFALNFGSGSSGPVAARPAAGAGRKPVTARTALRVDVPALPQPGETFDVGVSVSGVCDAQALAMEIGYDRSVAEMVGAGPGELLGRQGAQSIVLSPRAGRVDAALLGRGARLDGEGELVRVHFRLRAAGDPAIALTRVDARDGSNRKLDTVTAAPEIPAVTAFAPAAPNPFRGSTVLAFTLASPGAIGMTIYSVDGRRVRTLARDVREAGAYHLVWDGTDEIGDGVRPGVYYARLVTPQGKFTRTLVLMR